MLTDDHLSWYWGGYIGPVSTFIASISAMFGTFIGWRIGAQRRADELARHKAVESVAHADSITRRFELLLRGYEARIQELTTEVHDLRSEVVELRTALNKQANQITGFGV